MSKDDAYGEVKIKRNKKQCHEWVERGIAILNLGAWKDFDVKERLQGRGS